MAKFEFKGKTYYIDGGLQDQLVKKIVPELSKKDKDRVVIVDGRERSGKSVFGMCLGAFMASQLKSEFNISNICMTPMEFKSKVETAEKNEVIIYDEAHRGMGSSSALSEVNKLLKDLMMEMGQRNLFVIVILPTFFLLERYVALFRASGVFHIYESKGNRGFWVYFNQKNKQRLYFKGKKEFNYNCFKWPQTRGRFIDQYPLDEQEYRKKKALSFKDTKRVTKNDVHITQRNLLLKMLFEVGQFQSVWELYTELKRYDTNKILPKKSYIYKIFSEIGLIE